MNKDDESKSCEFLGMDFVFLFLEGGERLLSKMGRMDGRARREMQTEATRRRRG